ncbi:MAG: OmpA family protein [Flavobacteriales bacterium]|nr:OmpA family protein [Flavobacteriales bacterium]MCX7649126.1 OmpA family protein [Flavobacteriales bacterium]MDW8410537.1 OmpA family protein [Flavobacteriales bacterium]
MRFHPAPVLGLIFIVIVGALPTACVSRKKYDEQVARLRQCEEELAMYRRESASQLEEAARETQQLRSELTHLRADTLRLANELRRLRTDYKRLQEEKQDLERHLQEAIKRTQGETSEILSILKEREERLKKIEDDLRQKQKILEQQQAELSEKERRVQELERLLAEQKEALNSLLTRIQNALKGYSGQGLRVYEKDGKVYVSLDEQLLFESGRTEVKPEGVKALQTLANVLEKEKDISLMVEGHTDNVPLRPGSLMKDNWDLSVLRATAVARIILQNPHIAPVRITAAGRGEYLPVAPNSTPEGRAQNRRTDIIITPRIQDILEVLKKNY